MEIMSYGRKFLLYYILLKNRLVHVDVSHNGAPFGRFLEMIFAAVVVTNGQGPPFPSNFPFYVDRSEDEQEQQEKEPWS